LTPFLFITVYQSVQSYISGRLHPSVLSKHHRMPLIGMFQTDATHV